MKKLIWVFVISFLLSWVIMPLRGGYLEMSLMSGHQEGLLLYLVVYFFLTYSVCNRFSTEKFGVVLAIAIGCMCCELPAYLFDIKGSIIELDLISRIAAILAGFLMSYCTEKREKWLVACLYVVMAFLVLAYAARPLLL
jgi:hypothetical protein